MRVGIVATGLAGLAALIGLNVRDIHAIKKNAIIESEVASYIPGKTHYWGIDNDEDKTIDEIFVEYEIITSIGNIVSRREEYNKGNPEFEKVYQKMMEGDRIK